MRLRACRRGAIKWSRVMLGHAETERASRFTGFSDALRQNTPQRVSIAIEVGVILGF